MAIHIPLSLEAQSEARLLMLAPNNFLSPATGQPIIMPSQDMILGCYYLTADNPSQQKGAGQYFSSLEDALRAYEQTKLSLHSHIWVRFDGKVKQSKEEYISRRINNLDKSATIHFTNRKVRETHEGKILVQYIRTTPGRILLNQTIQNALFS